MRDSLAVVAGLKMNGNEFLKRLKEYGKARGLTVEFHEERGKGSHGTVCLGQSFAILKDRKKEISKGLLHGMLKALGVDHRDF
jgi:mRNA interferase HicA